MKSRQTPAKPTAKRPGNEKARHHGNGAGPEIERENNRSNHSARPPKGKATDSRTAVIAASRIRSVGIEIITTSPEKASALRALVATIPGNTVRTQEKRALEALARWSLSTFEASRFLDLYDPRARIMALRNQGHRISTT